jgi:hypothetical protein
MADLRARCHNPEGLHRKLASHGDTAVATGGRQFSIDPGPPKFLENAIPVNLPMHYCHLGVNPGDLHRPAGHASGRDKRLLKQKLQRKLHLARRLRLKDMVERRRTDVTVGQPEICAVQDVKQLRAKLQPR